MGKLADHIASWMRHHAQAAGAGGFVVGLSGGVDSAMSAALSVKALGKEKVLAMLLPDRESSPQSAEFAEEQARAARLRFADKRHAFVTARGILRSLLGPILIYLLRKWSSPTPSVPEIT